MRYEEMYDLPLYPFGYGLSYTSFAMDGLRIAKDTISPGEAVPVSFRVQNTGERAGTAVPQLYLQDCTASTVKPRMALAAFCKVDLEPGEKRDVTLEISPRSMRTLDPSFTWHIEPGAFRVFLAEDAEHPLASVPFRVTP